MRIIVTGVEGQLGHALTELAPTMDCDLLGLSRSELDISTLPESWTHLPDAQVLINAAAFTDVVGAESHRAQAYAVNDIGAANVARFCAARDMPLIHLSTDYVFGPDIGHPWTENDATNPLNVYGASKLAGENAIKAAGNKHIILRTCWLYSNRGKNFLRTMLNLGANRSSLDVVDDQIGAPTSVYALGKVLLQLAHIVSSDNRCFGIYHAAAAGRASWADFAEAIFQRAEPNPARRPQVVRVSSDAYGSKVTRPNNSVLNCRKLEKDFGLTFQNWEHELDGVFDRFHPAEGLP